LKLGYPGGAGEYDVQEGFGWTNGVFLALLDKYGDRIGVEDGRNPTGGSSNLTLNPFMVLVCWIVMFFIAKRN